MAPPAPPAKSPHAARRNWLGLSLRSLLLLFTLLGVWLGVVANRAREQRRIVAKTE